MQVFNISVPDKPLTNIELVRYARLLKIPDFRGVFMRDALPQYPLNWQPLDVLLSEKERKNLLRFVRADNAGGRTTLSENRDRIRPW